LLLFLLLHANGVVVFHLFPAAYINMTAVVLGAVIPSVETTMAPTKMTVMTTNEMHHSTPSTLPSNPHPREGEGEGNEGKGVGRCRGKQW
jgi:hypothetical protein